MNYQSRQIVYVTVHVDDGSDAIMRVTGPDGDTWRRVFYLLHSEKDVLDMWADNCIRNGVEDASRLDGWADLKPGEVTMTIRATYPNDD